MSKPLDIKSAYNISQAISTGIENLKKDPLWVLIGSLLFSVFQGLGSNSSGNFDMSMFENSDFGEVFMALLIGVVALQLCMSVVGWIGGAWIRTGWYRLHQNLLGGMDSGNTLFGGGDRFVDMLLWRLLAGLISLVPIIVFGSIIGLGVFLLPPSMTAIGVILAVVLGLILIVFMVYIHIGLYFGDHLVALDNKKPMEALSESWAMASGNRIHLFLYTFVLGLFAALGLLACCVGVIATSAITHIGTTEAYLLATRGHTNITTE